MGYFDEEGKVNQEPPKENKVIMTKVKTVEGVPIICILEPPIMERICESSARHFRFLQGTLPDKMIVRLPTIIHIEIGEESKDMVVEYGK